MGTTATAAFRGRGLLALAALLLATAAQAYEARFITADQVDLTVLLPPPPAADSPAARADLAAVIAAEAARTPGTSAAARADAEVSILRFADVLGPGFTAANLPKSLALFKLVSRDASQVTLRGKDYWRRPRPYVASPDVHPIVDVSTDGSYPSGHASFGCMAGVLLGALVPEKRAELLARGREYGRNRIVAGVHYPTDVEAGCLAGTVTAAVLLQAPSFQAPFAEAREEMRHALGLDKPAR